MPTGVVIGFDSDSYHVSEDAGTVTLAVRVLSGELQTQVSTQFFTSSYNAVGKYYETELLSYGASCL